MLKTVCQLRLLAFGLVFAFFLNAIGILPLAQAQDIVLPQPGKMVKLSPAFNTPLLKGIKVHPDNPFRFEFILDQGDGVIASTAKALPAGRQESLKEQSTKLIKYFLASLTTPEKDLWVNLSPYEKDRIIPESFGQTEMGRDLLAQDYILKQISASLIYPEDEIGKKFWKMVYEESAKKFGTTKIPVNTFNKVWIVPEKAVVYENAKAGMAYVVESRLKVMLEEDYLALERNTPAVSLRKQSAGASQIVRDIILPELEREINQGKNFAQLRQVYNSLILANWYKKKIKDSILNQVYSNKNKVAGLNPAYRQAGAYPLTLNAQEIYQKYLQAFKKGVFNYIKDTDAPNCISEPRKYFSGGIDWGAKNLNAAMVINNHISDAAILIDNKKNLIEVVADAASVSGKDQEVLKYSKDLDVYLRLGNALDERVENGEVNYEIFVKPESQDIIDGNERPFYRGNIKLIFKDGKLLKWEQINISPKRAKIVPWLEEYLGNQLKQLKGIAFQNQIFTWGDNLYIDPQLKDRLINEKSRDLSGGEFVVGDSSSGNSVRVRYATRYYSPFHGPLSSQEERIRSISLALKTASPKAIARAANEMYQFIKPDDILVPIPSSKGDTSVNLRLANRLVELSGAHIRDVLRKRFSTESQRALKHRGLRGLTAEEMEVYSIDRTLDGKHVVFIDNVASTGETMRAAYLAVGGGRGLVYSKGMGDAGADLKVEENQGMVNQSTHRTPKEVGGIDFTPVKMNAQTNNAGEAIKFHMDPAMIEQMRNASGFTPVIVNIQPLGDLKQFLGIGAGHSV